MKQKNTNANITMNNSTRNSKNNFSKTILLLAVVAILSMQLIQTAYAATGALATNGADLRLSLVNQDPDPAAAGETVNLRIGAANQGLTSLNNVVVQVIPSYPFEELSGENLTTVIATLGQYQTDSDAQIVKVKLLVNSQANAGTYNLKVRTYMVGQTSSYTETTIPVVVDTRKNVQVIYVDKTVIVPGQETPVTFTINNVGKSDLKNMQFTWENKNGIILPVSGTAGRYIDSLGVGQSINLTYTVIASTTAGADLYPLQLTLSYDSATGNSSSFSTVAGIYVGGGTNFDVSFGGNNNGMISLNIANTGSNPATAVAITIPNQDSWKVSGAKTAMVGSLNKGDYTIASFNLIQAGKPAPLTVTVDYTSTKGDRVSKEFSVDINSNSGVNGTGFAGRTGSMTGTGSRTTTSTTTSWFSTTNIIIAVLLVIIGIMIYKRQSEKNTKKK